MASFLSWTYRQRVWPPIRNQTLEPQVTNDLVARQAIHSVHVWEGTRRKSEGEVGGTPDLNISIWKGDLSWRLEVKFNSLELTSPRQRPNFLSLQTSTATGSPFIQQTDEAFKRHLRRGCCDKNHKGRPNLRQVGRTDSCHRSWDTGKMSVNCITKVNEVATAIDRGTDCYYLIFLSKEVECSDESLQSHVACTVKRLHNTMVPCHSWDKWRWTAPSGWKKACKIKLKNACIRL